MRGPAVAAALIYICGSIGGAAAGEPGLLAAARAGDPGRLSDEARRIGSAGLARLVGSRDRETRQAAVAAAPFAPEPWIVAPGLVTLLGGTDRPSASASARALAEIGQGLDRESIERSEAPPDEVEAVVAGCAAAAKRQELAPDVRVHALECAVSWRDALGQGAGGAGDPAAELLADPDAEVRRAAIYHVPPGTAEMRTALAHLVEGDADVEVAATAAAAMCRSDPPAGLAALSGDGRARLRAVAVDPAVEPGVVIGVLPCLRAGDAGDKAVLDVLTKKGPMVVRAQLRRK